MSKNKGKSKIEITDEGGTKAADIVCLGCFRLKKMTKEKTAQCYDCRQMDDLVAKNKMTATSDDEGKVGPI